MRLVTVLAALLLTGSVFAQSKSPSPQSSLSGRGGTATESALASDDLLWKKLDARVGEMVERFDGVIGVAIVGAPEKEFEDGEPHDMKLYYPVDPKQLPKELNGVVWPREER
jgi:hypothetical protein